MIEIKNLTKTFGEMKALNNLSLTVNDGSILGLVGSNGAGKSTLLRVLAGIYKPDGGGVFIDGAAPFENVDAKRKTTFISDYPYFSSTDTVNKLASMYRSIYPNWSEEQFNYLKSVFPISFNARINNMSKGMQRQAAIILGISAMPKCILFDEIFDGLDPVIRELVKKILIDFVVRNNASVIIASHNLRELEDLCDHVSLLHFGGVLFDDELDTLKLGITRVQFVLENPEDFEMIREKINIVKCSVQGKIFEITARDNSENVTELINSINPVLCEALPLTLEELFISEMEVAGYDINNLVK